MDNKVKTNLDKVALITGASAGIGWAVADALATAGYRVVITARRLDRLNALKDKLDASGASVDVFQADARDESKLRALFSYIKREYGRLDVLVNNAGLGRNAPLLSGETNAWREMFDVNVIALSICTREAVTLMKTNGDRGQIVHISSMSGHRVPTGTGGMYSATKHAVKALTEALRRELRAMGSHIKVTAISPGFVETEFAEVMSGSRETAEAVYARFPCLQPADIAATVMHILSQPDHVQIHDVLLRPTQQPS